MAQISLSEQLATSGSNSKRIEPKTKAARSKVWRLVRRMVLPAAILIVWGALTESGWISSASLPSPLAVVEAWWEWIFGPRQALAWSSGTWGPYVLMSLQRVAAGFAIASVAE